MALAILELLDRDDEVLHFRIDTGTNPFYQLKVGTQVRTDVGIDLLDEVYYATPLSRSPASGSPLDSALELSVPAQLFDRRNSYAQLSTFKTAAGRSPAFSRPVAVAVLNVAPRVNGHTRAHSFSQGLSTNVHAPARRIPHRSAALARQASVDEVVSSILRLAGPLVTQLLQGTAAPAVGAPAAQGAPGGDVLSIVGSLLRAIAGPLAAPAAPTTSTSHSLSVRTNRFSKPFIFGIDDALIGAAIGQLVQVLPQLANAANQRRVQLKQADNQLVQSILSDVNRRLLVERMSGLVGSGAGTAGASQADLAQIVALLSQAPSAAAAQPAAVTPPVTTAQSLRPPARVQTLSTRALLNFELGPALSWNGLNLPLFQRGKALSFKVRLNVGEPVPKAALPKAILKLVIRDAQQSDVGFEKIYKLKNIYAGQLLECPVDPGEIAQLPAQKRLTVLAELRWLTPRGGESKALGSTEIVLVGDRYLFDRGQDLNKNVELTDMAAYRPFWNKLWEAPVLDGRVDRNGRKKFSWELDVTARYSVLLSASQTSNGLMETRFLASEDDRDSLIARTRGRMKGGIELSINELNKLLPLWKDMSALDESQLEPFHSSEFARATAYELVSAIRLEGKQRHRGMVWVAPVLSLFSFQVAAVKGGDATGQVTQVGTERISFPIPVAGRILGLLSSGEEEQEETDEEPDGSEPISDSTSSYQFTGFDIVVNQKVMLTEPNVGAK